MNKHGSIIFLFDVTNKIERSLQCPVIFFTEIDFADTIFNTLLCMSHAIYESAPPETVLEIIKKFHNEWLHAVKKVETFKKNLKSIPREAVLKAIDFTIKCLENRYVCLNDSIRELQPSLSYEEKELMEANLEIISELQQIHQQALLDKQDNMLKQTDKKEYLNQVYDEIEDLLTWLDRQYDNLASHFTKVLELNIPIATSDLATILKQIIDKIAKASKSEAKTINSLVKLKDKASSQIIPITSHQELEISRLVKKIQDLEERIRKLETLNSPAVMALRHRSLYLKDKVESLQNLKESMVRLQQQTSIFDQTINERIFNHSLQAKDRAELVERLVNIWDSAIIVASQDSVVSILSVTKYKEVFTDTIGKFTVDKYGRKIYTKDDKKYQLNENNELVLVDDDKNRPYFYDDCGRYYLNANLQRVYKSHENASEYLLSGTGILLKMKEVRNGIEYYYDRLGRYYINKHGQRIYREQGRTSEYEFDGIGNLIKMATPHYLHESYEKKPLTVEENQYLQRVVGQALKKCIANVILHRPSDPIAYLANSLVKYKLSLDEEQKNSGNEKERLESALLYTTKNNTPSATDFNVKDYELVYNLHEGEY